MQDCVCPSGSLGECEGPFHTRVEITWHEQMAEEMGPAWHLSDIPPCPGHGGRATSGLTASGGPHTQSCLLPQAVILGTSQ